MDSSSFLLHQLPACEPPPDLFEKTLSGVARARKRALYTRFSLAFTGLVMCISYGVWHSQVLQAEFQTSAFFGFIQLAVSDPDILFRSLTDFSLGLLESLPVNLLLLGSILILCVVGILSLLQRVPRRAHPSFPHLFLH